MRHMRLAVAGLIVSALFLAGCARTAEQRATRYLDAGKKYLETRDFQRAAFYFRAAIRTHPKWAEPQYRLALTYIGAGAVDQAAAALRKTIQLDPNHLDAQLRLAELMTASGNEELIRKAQEDTESILEKSPDNADALFVMASARLRLGQPADAEIYLRQAFEAQPQHLKAAATLAMLKLAQRDTAAAERILVQAVEQNPKRPEPLVALGNLYLTLKKNADAKSAFSRAAALDPMSGPALLFLGIVQFQTGETAAAEQTFKRIAALPEKPYQHLYALFLATVGRVDEAIRELEALHKRYPEDRESRDRLVAAYLLAHRTRDAEQMLTAALKANRKDIGALMDRARVSLAAARYESAQSDLTQVLQFQPASAEARYLLARVYQAQGNLLQQRQELNEALRIKPDLLAARIELIRLFLLTRSPQTALDLLNETPERQRDAVQLLALKNWALIMTGDTQGARKAVDYSLSRFQTPDILAQDSLLKLGTRDYAAARYAAELALRQNPEHILALRTLVTSYVRQNQPAQATAALQQRAAERPKSAALHMLLANWLLEQGQRKEARAALLGVKSADPKHSGADVALASLDIAEGNLNSARGFLTKAVDSNPVNREAWLLLATVEERAGNFKSAIAHYRKVLRLEATHVVALNNLAYRLAEDNGDLTEALALAQRAKALAPENAGVDDTLGWILYRKGIYGTAAPHLEKAAAANDLGAVPKYHLAMTYLKLGEAAKARPVLEAALKIDPTLPEAKVARDLLAATATRKQTADR